MSDYMEMSGEALSAFLDAHPVAQCGRCGRKTWETRAIGEEDRMTQPDGFPCGGLFQAVSGE